MNNATFKTIGEILYQPYSEKKKIVIPNYQRGYKWSVKIAGKESYGMSAVEKLLSDIAVPCMNGEDYFLQGITVQEDDNTIVVIDGQQRLTTIYLLIWYCGGTKAIADIDLKYDIRTDSEEFLNDLKSKDPDKASIQPLDDDKQDIYYFKQALKQTNDFFEGKDGLKGKIEDYIKHRIRIIYITVDSQEKAVRTFTMMNGAKANMLDEELVKAEILRQASRPLPQENIRSTSVGLDRWFDMLCEGYMEEWTATALRGRYAREWDKWLYWWNRKDVCDYFDVSTPMGLLLDFYYRNEAGKNSDFSFSSFSKLIGGADALEINRRTKHIFKNLKHLQKSFEDLYNDPVTYNWLGLSLKCDRTNEKYEITRYFIEHKNDRKGQEWYAKCRMAGATHKEITGNGEDDDKLQSKQRIFMDSVLSPDAYESAPFQCYKFLLYLNIREDNNLGRKFDFSIWSEKSLEHIFPKSMVYHIDENGDYYRGDGGKCSETEVVAIKSGETGWMARTEIESKSVNKITEHSIGNLVLLYGRNNSEFGNKSFSEKKKTFFNVNDDGFRSRNLLHSIAKFAKSDWRAEEIADYYNEIKTQIDSLYEK